LVLGGLAGTVQCLAISPDGKRLAAGGGFYSPEVEGGLTLWDVATGKVIWTRGVKETTVKSAAFSPDGRSLAGGYGVYYVQAKGHVKVWDVASGQEKPFLADLAGGINALAFHPDGQRIALAGQGRVEIWDVTTQAKARGDLNGHDNYVYCVAFSPDGKT